MSTSTTEAKPLPTREILSADDLAAWLGISEDLIQKMVADGMPRIQLGGRRFGYHPPTVVDWLVRHRTIAEAPRHEQPVSARQRMGDPVPRPQSAA